MAGVNKVILLGNLGKDPEIRTIDGGKRVASFTLATTEAYRNQQGERIENTEWHNIVFWGPVCDVIERYLKKGTQVYVEGKLQTRSYEDKDGNKKYITEINGKDLTLTGKPPVANANEQPNNVSNTSDDLPF